MAPTVGFGASASDTEDSGSQGWNDLNQLIKISDLNHKFD